MGGRRARSIVEIVGTGLAAQKVRFARAVGAEDSEAIATTSAKLLGASEKAVDIVYYASKLADFVRKMVESGKDLSYEERQKQARKEWSRIKKREGLKHDPITTQAIVSAAAKAIAKTRK